MAKKNSGSLIFFKIPYATDGAAVADIATIVLMTFGAVGIALKLRRKKEICGRIVLAFAKEKYVLGSRHYCIMRESRYLEINYLKRKI